jgi:tetratricopeptide (TPR) repeat protein
VIVVPDPYHPPPEALRDPELEKLTCDGQNVDELLDVIRQLNRQLSAENVHKEIQCLNAATALEPNSFALQLLGSRVYTIATTSREIVGNERQEFLEKSLALARSALAHDPRSVEAQDQLRAALHNLGKIDEEEKATQELTGDNNPPAVQKWAYTDLVGICDARNNRRDALIAARKAEQIEEIINQLEAINENDLTFSSVGMIGREDLAAREEEAGEYAQAASDYESARKFAKPGLYYDAVFFKIDMGLARSLRHAGQSRDADGLCNHWRHKAQGNIHIIGGPDHGGGALDWGGSDVANATWEYSCGDFDKGVQDLIRISESRLQNPSDKWGEGTVGIYLRAPIEGLESAFLSRGRTETARQTRAILSLDLDSASRNQLDEALKRLEKLQGSLKTVNP